MLPYQNATSGDRALANLQRALAEFGCQSFGTMHDAERGVTIVQFRWKDRTVSLEASWRGYAAAWLRAYPWTSRRRVPRHKYEAAALEQAKCSVCSVLRDWVKGQITAVECGVMSFDAAFLPHLLLPNGQRFFDRARQQNLLGHSNAETSEAKP